MDDHSRRQLEACIRGTGFGVSHADSLPEGSRGHELFTALDAKIDQIQTHAEAHESGKRTGLQASASKNLIRNELLAQLERINRTSRVLELRIPGTQRQFRMPEPFPEQDLLTAARSFHTNGTLLKADFLREEMPADFLDQLGTTITNLEAAIGQANSARGSKVSAHEEQGDHIAEAMSILRQLDVVIRNKFAGNRGVLAEWTSASHVERPSRHASPPPPAPPSTPNPSSDPSQEV